jgi:hypothetical protein
MRKIAFFIGLVVGLLMIVSNPSVAQTINACANIKNGALRIVTASSDCTKFENHISWSSSGGSSNGIARAVYGHVTDGIADEGAGFTCQFAGCMGSACTYTITFTQPFSIPPSCVATPDYMPGDPIPPFAIGNRSPGSFTYFFDYVGGQTFSFICME